MYLKTSKWFITMETDTQLKLINNTTNNSFTYQKYNSRYVQGSGSNLQSCSVSLKVADREFHLDGGLSGYIPILNITVQLRSPIQKLLYMK
jgi:hypothetical protein